MLVTILLEMHVSVYFILGIFKIIYFSMIYTMLPGENMCIFCFWYMSVWICGNLNVENKMRDMGKGTYLVVKKCESGVQPQVYPCKLGIWKLLEWMWTQDAYRWLTHCSCESRAQLLVHPLWLRNFGKLLNECEPKDACRRVHPL